MVVIELQFPAGRYHANPWGRNINEGVPEWPPSPFRLARGLIDVWYRRRQNWPASRMEPILQVLSSRVSFSLPQGRFAHTRSFLASNTQDSTDRQKIFDPFVAVERDSVLAMGFHSEISDQVRSDLEELLAQMNYLGRSESWITARVGRDARPWNCTLAETAGSERTSERVQVACLRPPADYVALAMKPQKTITTGTGRKRTITTEEFDWKTSLELSSSDLLRDGWNLHPGAVFREYTFPRSLTERRSRPSHGRKTNFRWARFSLSSKVLPVVTETILVSERIRRKLMGIDRRLQGDDPTRISPTFSGKDADGKPAQNHHHAFFLPVDEDADGWLDHLYVHVREPFSRDEVKVLDRCRSVWQPKGRPDLLLVLSSLTDEPPVKPTKVWRSATPFITNRHYRRGRGSYDEWLFQEVCRECRFHGYPEPVGIEMILSTKAVRSHRWMEFLRARKGQAERPGYGFRLTFAEPVSGPFALGSGCHYGLGLFLPES